MAARAKSSQQLLLVLLLHLLTSPRPSQAPFPPDDPRAVFNAFVIPWWYRVPRSFRSYVHRQFTGHPLPPEEEPPPPHERGRLTKFQQVWTGLYADSGRRKESPFQKTMKKMARNYRRNLLGKKGSRRREDWRRRTGQKQEGRDRSRWWWPRLRWRRRRYG